MSFLQAHIETIIGGFLLLLSLCMLVFPPKFRSPYYGISTKWTLKSEAAWALGQKMFGLSIFIIGLLFFIIGMFQLRKNIPSVTLIFLFIILWSLSRTLINNILQKKFPDPSSEA